MCRLFHPGLLENFVAKGVSSSVPTEKVTEIVMEAANKAISAFQDFVSASIATQGVLSTIL